MKLRFLFIGLFIFTVVAAQDFVMKEKLADLYYSRFDYNKAITMYEQLLISYPRNYEIYEKLADSYRRINDSHNAERCYAFLVDTTNVNHDYLLYYAQELARNGNYKEAVAWYKKYDEAVPDDPRGKLFAQAYQDMGSFYKDSSSFIIRKSPFCSEASDFGPVYYKNGLVFASARSKYSIIRSVYNWTNSSYLDLYFTYPDSAIVTPFSTAINSIYHDGPATFSKNQDTIIFTRSNFYHWRFKKSDEGVNKLKLFVATWDALLKCWANIKPMQFNSDQYSVGHPALSKDGSDLYFASDMPGGLGGTDIYVSHKITDSLGNRKWGEPVNLGAEINTRGNEMFPFVDNEGNLWFASNGLPGLGGLDVFIAKKTANGFAKPVNPGYPLNTRFDDFAYITQNGGKDGYISSDRYNKIGDDDIFSVTLNKLALIGLVRDTTNQNKPVENAEVDLCFSDNSLVNKVQTKTDGMFEFPLSFDKNYTVKALKTGYADNKQGLSTVGSKAGKISIIMNLGKARQVVLFCTVIDKKTGEKLNDVEINIVDTCKQLLVADTTTSVDGSFRKSVPNVKINDKLGYQITINKKGYLTKKVSFDHIVTSYEIDLNNFLEVSLDKIDVGTDIGKLLKINPIYFDLGKWDIRKDAAVELDKVVKAMIDNPNLVIELGSHTDSRGSSQSNLILSDKRAKSSAAYIVSKGIDKGRIFGKGYGKTQLINKCADGVPCTEEEHAVNRRTEFKIIKF